MRYLLVVFLLFSSYFVGRGETHTWNVHLEEAGTLYQFKSTCPSTTEPIDVKITGKMNAEDLNILSSIFYHAYYTLDLSEVDITEIPMKAYRNNHDSYIIGFDNVEYDKDGNKIGISYLTKLILPSTVTEISPDAFFDCKTLKKIDLSRCENLIRVGWSAFDRCNALESIDFTHCSKLKKIEQAAFGDTDLSKGIILPPNLEIIEAGAFQRTSFKEIEIPSSVKSIGNGSFDGCTGNIKMCSSEPVCWINGDRGEIGYSFGSCRLKVPSGALPRYQKNEMWGNLELEEYNPNGGELLYRTVQVSYNEGIGVRRNDYDGEYINSGFSTSVTDQTDVAFYIFADIGYHLKRIMVGDRDMTSELKDGVLLFPYLSEDLNIQIVAEPYKWTVQVFYGEGGVVLKDGEIIVSGSSISGEARKEIFFDIKPNTGFSWGGPKTIESSDIYVQRDGSSMNRIGVYAEGDGKNGILKLAFRKDDCKIKATCAGGTIELYDNDGNLLKMPSDPRYSLTVKPLSDIKMIILPFNGYHLKSVKINGKDMTEQVQENILMITSIYEDKEIEVICEADPPKTFDYTIKTFGEGSVYVNKVPSNLSGIVSAFSEVKIFIVPKKDCFLKHLKINGEDVTDQVKENIFIIPSISEDIEINVSFEKGAPSSYTFQVNVSGNGKVKVGGKTIENGNSVTVPVAGTKLEFLPDKQYRVARVLFGSKDITKDIVDNIYNVTSVSSDMSLSVTFERYLFDMSILLQFDGESVNLGEIKVGDQTINCYFNSGYINYLNIEDLQKGSTIPILFMPDEKYFELEEVVLEGMDITSQIQKGNYQIQSINSDLSLSVKFKRKSYTLIFDELQHVEKIRVNYKDYPEETTQVEIASGKNIIDFYLDYRYTVKQAFLDGKKIYEKSSYSNFHSFEVDMDSDKNIKIATVLNIDGRTSLNVAEPGTLKSMLTDEDMNNREQLSLKGTIDQRDFVVLNQMKSLKDLSIEEGTTIVAYGSYPANTIPEKAFFNNQILEHISFQTSSVKAIGNSAFEGSKSYSVNLSGENIKIGDKAYKDCTLLEDIYISASELGVGAFEGCTNLQTVSISDELECIQADAFKNCTLLKEISLKGQLKSMGENVFYNCKNLEYLFMESGIVPDIKLNTFDDSNYYSMKLMLRDRANLYYRYKHHEVWKNFDIIMGHLDSKRITLTEYPQGGRVLYKREEEFLTIWWSIMETDGSNFYCYEHVKLFFEPWDGYMIEYVFLDGKDITKELDKDNQFMIFELDKDMELSVKFKKEDTSTGIDQPENATKRVYRSASRRLVLSGFEASVPVYVYDGSGRLVVLKTIQDSVEEVEVPADGLYFVCVGKESFKVIL